jgi:hypothetical protein
MDSDKVFIVGGRSFIHIMKSKGHKIDPWGTPCFTVPPFEEISQIILFQFFVFYLSDMI